MHGSQPLPQQASRSGCAGGWGIGSGSGVGGVGIIAIDCAGEQNQAMQFSNLPSSDHPLVLLRPIEVADLPAWFGYLSEPAVHEHTSWRPLSQAELAHHVCDPASRTPASLLRLAIADRSTGAMVGSIGFHSIAPEHRSAELAYDLSPGLWGRGIASQMVCTLVDWAHDHVGLLRVQATALSTNTRSLRLLARCGFEREGLLRSYRLVRGRPGDFWMHSHVVSPEAVG